MDRVFFDAWKAVRIHSPQVNGYRLVAVALWATPFLSAALDQP